MTPQEQQRLNAMYPVPELQETQGGLDALGRRIAAIPGYFARTAPQAWAGIQALYQDPSRILQTPTAQSIASGVTLPRDVWQGKVDPNSDDFLQRQMDMAGLMMPGGVGGTGAGSGVALGSGPVRRGGGRLVGPGGTDLSEIVARAEARSAERATPASVTADDGGRYQHALPQFAERYPESGGFEIKQKGTAKNPREGSYEAKVQTPEEELLMEQRRKVIADMEREGYEPYFDVAARQDVDPANYPKPGNTITDATAKTEATRQKYYEQARAPESVARIKAAYEHGESLPGAGNWYFVKQLEDKFIKEYGPEEGRRQFQQKFPGAMAATTAAMSPSNNLLAAHYGNYLREKGLPFPEKSHEVPSPLGGPYTKGNLDEYQRTYVGDEAPMTSSTANPKRFDFEYAFLGHPSAVVDKQMSQLFDPKLAMPPDYGQYSKVLGELAQEYGVDPRYFQETAWGGAKNMKTRKEPMRDPNVRWNSPDYGGGFEPNPMMNVINEAIERTSRLTGLSPEEVVKRGLVRSEIPMYQGGLPGASMNREDRR